MAKKQPSSPKPSSTANLPPEQVAVLREECGGLKGEKRKSCETRVLAEIASAPKTPAPVAPKPKSKK